MKNRGIRLRTKLGLGIGALIALLLISGGISFYGNQHTNALYQEMKTDKTMLFLVKSIQYQLTGYSSNERAYLLNHDPSFLDFMQTQKTQLTEDLQTLKGLPDLDPQDVERIGAIEQNLTSFLTDSQEALGLFEQDKVAEASIIHFGRQQTAQIAMDGDVRKLIEKVDAEITTDQTIVDQQTAMINMITAALALLSVLVGLLFGWMLLRLIVRPIKQMNKQLLEIAEGEGDLTKEIHLRTQDEIGDMSRSFNRMLSNLRSIINDVRSTAEQVAASSEELHANSEQATQATEQIVHAMQTMNVESDQQVGHVQATTGTVHRIQSSVADITLNTQSVNHNATLASEKAREGNEEIQVAIRQMHTISSTIHGLSQAVQALGTRSHEIGQIVEVITGIAGQTNLLALNAAIEASRAGAAGKGFAVVADEIRKLADQSNQSAYQISELIATIQDLTDQAVQSMNKGSKEVVIGLDVVNKAGGTFEQIQHAVDQVAEEIDTVSTATTQITHGVTEVAHSITSVASVAETTSATSQKVSAATEQQLASMEDIAFATNELSKISEQLLTTIAKFKTQA